jgi:Flp pilus assembly pilin Flp
MIACSYLSLIIVTGFKKLNDALKNELIAAFVALLMAANIS